MMKQIELSSAMAKAVAAAIDAAGDKISLDDYTLIVTDEFDSFEISFVVKNMPKGQRGTITGKPGINYIIDKKTSEIIREYRTR